MKQTNRLSSQNGSVLIGAMMVSFIMTVITVAILMRAESLDNFSRYPKIKGAITSMETRLRLAAMSSSSYFCTGATFDTCSINPAVMTEIAASFTRLVCTSDQIAAGAPNCGFRVINPMINSNKLFTATIRLINGKADVRDIPIRYQVPADFIFDSSVTSCPPSAPFFMGYDPVTGLRRPCKPLTAACAAGQYVKSVDQKDFTIVCQDIKPAPPVSCGTDELIGNFSWTGVNGAGQPTFSHTCQSRLDPFPYFDNSSSITQNIVGPQPLNPANTPDPVPPDVSTSCIYSGPPSVSCTPPGPPGPYIY